MTKTDVTALHKKIERLEAEIIRLRRTLNSPELEVFMEGVKREAAHQVERWGDEHDASKAPWDWHWVLGSLSSKAVMAMVNRDWRKAKHHTITAAALCANWHKHLKRIEGEIDAQR